MPDFPGPPPGNHPPATVRLEAIPRQERDRVWLTYSEAIAAADAGRKVTGYGLLTAGVDDTRALDTEWAAELHELWGAVLAAYLQRYPCEWIEKEPRLDNR